MATPSPSGKLPCTAAPALQPAACPPHHPHHHLQPASVVVQASPYQPLSPPLSPNPADDFRERAPPALTLRTPAAEPAPAARMRSEPRWPAALRPITRAVDGDGGHIEKRLACPAAGDTSLTPTSKSRPTSPPLRPLMRASSSPIALWAPAPRRHIPPKQLARLMDDDFIEPFSTSLSRDPCRPSAFRHSEAGEAPASPDVAKSDDACVAVLSVCQKTLRSRGGVSASPDTTRGTARSSAFSSGSLALAPDCQCHFSSIYQ